MNVGDLRRLIAPLTDECTVKLRLLPGGGDVFIGEHAPVDDDQSGHFLFDGEGMLILTQAPITPAYLALDALKHPPIRRLTCGCCTNGCVCFNHQDVNRGLPPKKCERHP